MLLGVETLALQRPAGTVQRLGPEMDEAFKACGTQWMRSVARWKSVAFCKQKSKVKGKVKGLAR